MAGCVEILRREFKRKNLGFTGVREERFCASQWRWPGWVYLTYRLVLAFYLLFWLGYTSGNFHGGKRGSGWTWGAALTNWTYALLAVYATWHLIATIIHYTQVTVNPPESSSESSSCWRRPSEDFHNALFTELNEGLYERVTEEAGGRGTSTTSARDRLDTSRPAWYLCVVWILYSAVSSFAVIVTVVYFAVLHDWTEVIDVSNLQVHAFNSLLVFLEHSVSAIPYRLLHVVYPLLYGLLYLLFSLYYWTTDHRKVVYPILDWNKPWIIAVCIISIGFVLLPLCHGFYFLLYKGRMALYRRNFLFCRV
ncbi:hypothetical protein BaRGS_00025956 [Batillaria attramentaria]|uniref:Protein rolling stone n=1 Tax=Batillaria attramentaria TaxID=370345 RepID=A0ABD0K7E3_9CAEN